jgi:predicted metal-dependent hydrolase
MPGVKPRASPIESLTVEGLRFAVRWSARRRTVGITVLRDGGLVVAAPAGTAARKLEDVVRAKLPWVRRKRAEFEALGPPPEPRQFVAGELFPYLGRPYRLTLADRPAQPVALAADALVVDRALDGEARAAVIAWYQRQAREYVDEAVARYAPLVAAKPSAVVVRDLGTRRWGVCDHRSRVVSFHWHLVTQAPDLLDYVVVHELTHLHVPSHQAAFWRRVELVLPEWRERRRRLSERAGDSRF